MGQSFPLALKNSICLVLHSHWLKNQVISWTLWRTYWGNLEVASYGRTQEDSRNHPAVSSPAAPVWKTENKWTGRIETRVFPVSLGKWDTEWGFGTHLNHHFPKSAPRSTDETQNALGQIIVGNGRDDLGVLLFGALRKNVHGPITDLEIIYRT